MEPNEMSRDEGKNSLPVGIKGCPTDLFLAQSVKFGQGDWYKVNNVLDPNFELVYNVRETNKITKESRIEWLIESVTSQQTANRIATENGLPGKDVDDNKIPGKDVDDSKIDEDNDINKENEVTESKKQSHRIRKWFRRLWNLVKCPCFSLPKRNNKVSDVFYEVDDTME